MYSPSITLNFSQNWRTIMLNFISSILSTYCFLQLSFEELIPFHPDAYTFHMLTFAEAASINRHSLFYAQEVWMSTFKHLAGKCILEGVKTFAVKTDLTLF